MAGEELDEGECSEREGEGGGEVKSSTREKDLESLLFDVVF